MRKIQFVNGEYYHIYNRTIEEVPLFRTEKDYLKFLRNLKDLNNKSFYEERKNIIATQGFKKLGSFLCKMEKVVSILSYSLITNHFHLILKQLTDDGISKFMHKLGISHTNYSNKINRRKGPLFQGPFKAIHINNNNYLLWLCGYINGNVEIHKAGESKSYKWSSFRYLLGLEENKILDDTGIILSQFSNQEGFEGFVKTVVNESRKRKDLEKYLLESLSEKEPSSLLS